MNHQVTSTSSHKYGNTSNNTHGHTQHHTSSYQTTSQTGNRKVISSHVGDKTIVGNHMQVTSESQKRHPHESQWVSTSHSKGTTGKVTVSGSTTRNVGGVHQSTTSRTVTTQNHTSSHGGNGRTVSERQTTTVSSSGTRGQGLVHKSTHGHSGHHQNEVHVLKSSSHGHQTTTNHSGDHLTIHNRENAISTGRKSMADYSRARVVSVIEGKGHLVEVNEGEGRVIDMIKKEGYITDIKTFEGETRIVEERELERSVRKSVVHMRKPEEQQVIVEKREKIIEIIKHVPVPVEKYVDVEVEIIVDIPIERTIEIEKIIEKIIEVPEERITEIPIEKIIEVPRKKVYQVDVEVPRTVEVIVEKVVKQVIRNPVEKINYTYRTIECSESDLHKYQHQHHVEIMDTQVNLENVDRIIEVPKEHINIIEQEVPRYVDVVVPVETFRRSKRVVEVPVTVEVEKEHVVEIAVPVEVIKRVDREVIEEYEVVKNVIEKVAIEKIVERPVEYETIVEKDVPVYVDNIIEVEKTRYVDREVEEEYIVEVPVENIVENIIEIVKIVERPVEKIINKDIHSLVLQENQVEVEIEHSNLIDKHVYIENKTLNILTMPREKEIIKESRVETIVEVPRTNIEEIEVELVEQHANIITNENVLEIQKHVDVEVERLVDELVISRVEHTKDKYIDVDVHEIREVAVENRVFNDTIKSVDMRKSVVNTESKMSSKEEEREDTQITSEINERRDRLQIWTTERNQLNSKLSQLKAEYQSFKVQLTSHSQREMLELMVQYEKKMVEYRNLNTKRNQLFRKSIRRSNRRSNHVKETKIHCHPRVAQLKRRLTAVIHENNELCNSITYKAEDLRKSLRRG